MARDDISGDYARARVRAQKDDAFYRLYCDWVFENDYQTREAAEDAARDFVSELLKANKEDTKNG